MCEHTHLQQYSHTNSSTFGVRTHKEHTHTNTNTAVPPKENTHKPNMAGRPPGKRAKRGGSQTRTAGRFGKKAATPAEPIDTSYQGDQEDNSCGSEHSHDSDHSNNSSSGGSVSEGVDGMSLANFISPFLAKFLPFRCHFGVNIFINGQCRANFFQKRPFFPKLNLTPVLDSSRPCDSCPPMFTFQFSLLNEKKVGTRGGKISPDGLYLVRTAFGLPHRTTSEHDELLHTRYIRYYSTLLDVCAHTTWCTLFFYESRHSGNYDGCCNSIDPGTRKRLPRTHTYIQGSLFGG